MEIEFDRGDIHINKILWKASLFRAGILWLQLPRFEAKPGACSWLTPEGSTVTTVMCEVMPDDIDSPLTKSSVWKRDMDDMIDS
jgi:hypothetical protein